MNETSETPIFQGLNDIEGVTSTRLGTQSKFEQILDLFDKLDSKQQDELVKLLVVRNQLLEPTADIIDSH